MSLVCCRSHNLSLLQIYQIVTGASISPDLVRNARIAKCAFRISRSGGSYILYSTAGAGEWLMLIEGTHQGVHTKVC